MPMSRDNASESGRVSDRRPRRNGGRSVCGGGCSNQGKGHSERQARYRRSGNGLSE
jgi:hypothetical protein